MTQQDVTTKAQLLAAMEQGWDDLNARLDMFSEAQMTHRTDAAGWTAKDHVIHLAMWEGSMNAFLQKQSRAEYMGVDPESWNSNDINRINAVIQQRNKDLSWAEVRQKFQQMHKELIGRIEALSEEDLQRPYHYFQPDSTATDPAIARFVRSTYTHYTRQLPWIEALAQSSGLTAKAQVLATMQTGWDDFNAYLDTLSETQMTQPTDAAGWTAKDHVIHLAVWEDSMNALFAGQNRMRSMGVDDREAWEKGDWDKINAVIYEHNKSLSLAAVRQHFLEVHERLIATLQSLSDDDLQRPYNTYQPDSTQTGAVINTLVGNTSAHYAEHRPWIEAIVRR